MHPGYQLIFDNINIYQRKRHKKKTNENSQKNMVHLYAARDRVNLQILPDDEPILADIRDLPDESWWLSAREQQFMRDEIKVSNTPLITMLLSTTYCFWII